MRHFEVTVGRVEAKRSRLATTMRNETYLEALGMLGAPEPTPAEANKGGRSPTR